jgi:D-3-phosphoglycerate dehydrogenase
MRTLVVGDGFIPEETNRTSARLVADAVAEYVETGRVPAAANAEALGWT